MNKTYRRWEPGQSLLFPPSPLDWVPEGHLARFVLDAAGGEAAARGYFNRLLGKAHGAQD